MEVESGSIFQNFEKVEVESGYFLKKIIKSVEKGKKSGHSGNIFFNSSKALARHVLRLKIYFVYFQNIEKRYYIFLFGERSEPKNFDIFDHFFLFLERLCS